MTAIASLVVCANAWAAPGSCPSDSKVLNGGPTKIYGEGPGTWWGLVINGLLVAGFVDEDDQIDYLNAVFGTNFDTLDELKAYNLQLVADTYDENRNGYVCAFQLRGTRAYYDNPYVDLTFFGISDDRVAKKQARIDSTRSVVASRRATEVAASHRRSAWAKHAPRTRRNWWGG